MALGGRPQKDEGHEPKNLSLDRETRRVLKLVKSNFRRESEFAERAIKELAAKPSFSFIFTNEKPSSK